MSTKSNLTPKWRKKLKDSGFQDLGDGARQSNRGNKLNTVDAPDTVDEKKNTARQVGAEYLELARQLLEDPSTPWPTRWHKTYWGFHAYKYGRVAIERELGNCDWRRLTRAVAWGDLQLDPVTRVELTKASALLKRRIAWPKGYRQVWALHAQGMTEENMSTVLGKSWTYLPLYEQAIAWGKAKQEQIEVKSAEDRNAKQLVRDLSVDEVLCFAAILVKDK